MVCSAGAAMADQAVIGEALEVINDVQVVHEGDGRALHVADGLRRLETVKAKRDSAAKLEFADGTTLSIGPRSEIVLDEFVYAADTSDNAIIRITKGHHPICQRADRQGRCRNPDARGNHWYSGHKFCGRCPRQDASGDGPGRCGNRPRDMCRH
jgi:hypothetical protein